MNGSTERRSAIDLGRALCLAGAIAVLTACGAPGPRPDAERPPAEAMPPPVDKGDPLARFNAAMKLWQDNQIQEAEQAFVELTEDFPQHSGPWTNLGILYARSNRRPLAIGAFTRAATVNAQNKVAFNWLGILNRESGNLERARQAYEKALQLDPDYALAHYNLGVLLDAHLKRPTDALPHYRAYLQASGREDLKVIAWIAEIEAGTAAAGAAKPEQMP